MIEIAHMPVCHIYKCNHTAMATAHDSGLILISVEYTTHCYVDFGQTARTFIYFGAHSNLDMLLLANDDRNQHSNYNGLQLPIYIDIDFGGIYDTLLC